MRLSNKTIIIGLVITFVILTCYTAYELMALAENITRKVGITEVAKIALAKEVTKFPYNLLLADFFVVLLLIFFFTTASFQQKQAPTHEGINLKYRQNGNANNGEEEEDNELQEWLDGFKLLLTQEKGSVGVLCNKALTLLCKKLEACTGAFYLANHDANPRFIEFVAGYAFILPDSQVLKYEYGEGIAGQSAKSGKETILNNVPNGYIKAFSGLGEATPRHLFVCPLVQNGQTIAVMEIASFTGLNRKQLELSREAGRLLTLAVRQGTVLSANNTFP